MDKIMLLKDMNVYKSNIKNSKGNKVKKDKILKAGEYAIINSRMDTGMVRHGNTIVQVKSEEYTFTIDLTDIEISNANHKATKYCETNNLKLFNVDFHKGIFVTLEENNGQPKFTEHSLL